MPRFSIGNTCDITTMASGWMIPEAAPWRTRARISSGPLTLAAPSRLPTRKTASAPI